VNALLVDLDDYQIEKDRYNLIANFYFLKRRLIPRIKKGLKKGGKVIFETYLLEHRTLAAGGPKQAKYFLERTNFSDSLKTFESYSIVKESSGRAEEERPWQA